MDLLLVCDDERSLSIWAEVAQHLDSCVRLFADAPWAPLLVAFVQRVFGPLHAWLHGDQGPGGLDAAIVSQFRAVVQGMLVQVREPTVLAHAHAAFHAYTATALDGAPVSSASAIVPDVRFAVYAAALQGTTALAWPTGTAPDLGPERCSGRREHL
jgi:hypothetical protein